MLAATVTWENLKINFTAEQVLLTEVQNNLVELEGLIAHQIEDDWSEPNLVTAELEDILNGIWLGMTTVEQLGALSESDKVTLSQLHSNLRQYPYDEIYSFANVTDEDIKNFEELRGILRDVGLGLNISINANKDSFMAQANALNKKIKTPLN
ncbi:hypothetical protein LG307_10205 [Sutcliffiella horikoshii]|uniref:hypothetical protein n=1 Tax=Sutcliffiella horikoshii TaxID=79883 RepID=UPI0038513F32